MRPGTSFWESTISAPGRTAIPAGCGQSARAAAITNPIFNHGDTAASNLNQCDRIRGWIDLCLAHLWGNRRENPKFLDRFEDN